ncbi:MAG: hypothetical protein DBX55_01840 [Verrucomicrobia bacterium]|nr:MAG: hypothetical protein DBX55_01840 [Verrucomicrobiota bacterium]
MRRAKTVSRLNEFFGGASKLKKDFFRLRGGFIARNTGGMRPENGHYILDKYRHESMLTFK